MITTEEFRKSVTLGTPNGEFHGAALASFFPRGAMALAVHLRALHLMTQSGWIRTATDEALMRTASHAANLFWEGTGLVVRGKFDVAAYLLRPAYDAAHILRVVASDGRLAADLLAGREVRAGDARADIVGQLRTVLGDTEPGLVDEIDRIYRDDAKALNLLSHVSIHHFNKTAEPGSGPNSMRTVLGGRKDTDEAATMLEGVVLSEIHTLMSLRMASDGRLGEEWDRLAVAAIEGLQDWMSTPRDLNSTDESG